MLIKLLTFFMYYNELSDVNTGKSVVTDQLLGGGFLLTFLGGGGTLATF